jgi:hypothetical protein
MEGEKKPRRISFRINYVKGWELNLGLPRYEVGISTS